MEITNVEEVSANAGRAAGGPKFPQAGGPVATKKPRRMWLIALGALTGALLVAAGLAYYIYTSRYESTDDAFIEGEIVQLSPKVPGTVRSVYIDDNQQVKKGDLLIEIDPRDFQARVAQAQAALRTALAQVALARDRLAQAESQVVAAQAEATKAGTDERRLAELFSRQLIARQEFDHAVADAQNTAAQAAAALREAQSQVAQEQAALESAKLQLSYTKIYAPVPGHVTQKTVEVGDYVQPGETLFAIVPAEFWVIANFKETQLANIRPGQPVEIRIDAFPDVRFHGHVDSIQSGSGAAFSVLPPENATGNYVKVVQRVPVRIVFDNTDFAAYPMGPGMSVEPTVMVR
jgi:membrane fusion protein (multidrug efflux system)